MPGSAWEYGLDGQWPEDPSDPRGLRAMCAYGAREVAAGKWDAVAFDCMPNERATVTEIMERDHPDVKFYFASQRRVLEHNARSKMQPKETTSA